MLKNTNTQNQLQKRERNQNRKKWLRKTRTNAYRKKTNQTSINLKTQTRGTVLVDGIFAVQQIKI